MPNPEPRWEVRQASVCPGTTSLDDQQNEQNFWQRGMQLQISSRVQQLERDTARGRNDADEQWDYY